jgi:hypothetical protein
VGSPGSAETPAPASVVEECGGSADEAGGRALGQAEPEPAGASARCSEGRVSPSGVYSNGEGAPFHLQVMSGDFGECGLCREEWVRLPRALLEGHKLRPHG